MFVPYHKTESLYQRENRQRQDRQRQNSHSEHADSDAQPAAELSSKTDIAIIGGGFTGISAALNLAERGYEVSVLEAAALGAGGSGRNGGHLCQGWSTDFEVIAKQLDPAYRQMAWEAGCEAVETVADRIATHKISCDLKWGYVHAALHKKQLDEALSMLDTYEAFHYPHMQALADKRALSAHIDSPAYIGGVFDRRSGHINPLKYLSGLADAAKQAGADIYEYMPVTAVHKTATGHRIELASGHQITARILLYCGNAYLGRLAPRQLKLRLAHVSSSILATTSLTKAQQTALLPTNAAIADGNTALNYFRLDAERRLIFGGRASYLNREPAHLEADLRKRLIAVFPSLANQPAEQVWTGQIGITVNRAPHFGRTKDGAYFAQGYSGHGVALSNLAGKMMAEAIARETERFEIFSHLKHLPFPGGPLRTPALALGMSWHKLRDWLQI